MRAAYPDAIEIRLVTQSALRTYKELFGGLPKVEGIEMKSLKINISGGVPKGEANPGKVDLVIGSQVFWGYATWKLALFHEIFHLWNAETFRYSTSKEQWFNEGATEYFAVKGAVKGGFLSKEDALNALSKAFSMYLGATGIGEISIREAGSPSLKRAHYGLVYFGGFAAVAILDFEIRRNSGGARSVDDLMKALYSQVSSSSNLYDVTHLQNISSQLAGKSLNEFFRRFIVGTEIIPLGQYFDFSHLYLVQSGLRNPGAKEAMLLQMLQ